MEKRIFRLNDLIKMKDGYWICILRDKELSCFAKTNKKASRTKYTKLFVCSTDNSSNNLKFELIKEL